MGGASSTETQPSLLEEHARTTVYRSPEEREMYRYSRSMQAPSAGVDMFSVDGPVDKYDYLICFPNDQVKQPGEGGDEEEDEEKAEEMDAGTSASRKRQLRKERLHKKKKKKGRRQRRKRRKVPKEQDGEPVEIERITFEQGCEDWLACVPGNDHVKTTAREQLVQEWKQRFRAGEPHAIDAVPRPNYLALCRELIIGYLMRKCGLQLKVTLSRDRDEVFCRIRASQKMLKLEADRINYKLPFKGEIDPGFEFWDEFEVAEQERRLERDKALVVLHKLYEAGKIPPEEMEIFEGETIDSWSRRIHNLERAVDKVPVTNTFPVHTDYHCEPRVQHLFRSHRGPYGPTFFTDKDRLVLTKSLIDKHLDCGVLAERGIINSCMALHDASRGSKLTREWLHNHWVKFWSGEGRWCGDITVEGRFTGPEEPTPWFRRPFAQPLNMVKDYYGEKIGLYFAWLGFYTQALIFPAIFGLFVQIIYILFGDHNLEEGVDWLQAALSICVCLWTVVYKELWDRENKVIAVKWGMEGYEEEEAPRPQFRGEPRRSLVNNHMEEYYPPHKRLAKQVVSFLVICVFIAGLLATLLFIYWFRDFMINDIGFALGAEVASLLQALQIQVQSYLFELVVENLNEWENHRTQTEYEDNLIFKTFLFQLFNNYSALFYTAFVKRYSYGCDDDDCMGELQLLMIIIFAVRMAMNAVELGLPLLKQKLALIEEERELRKQARRGRQGKDLLADTGDEEIAAMEPFEAETKLDEYDDTFGDYAEMVLQYGLVTMFVAPFPLAPFLAIIENVIEIRVDAYKMCHLVRRPDPSGAEDIGMWGNLLDAMSTLALFNNAAIIAFTTESFQEETTLQRFVIWMAVEHVLLFIKFFMHAAIPDDPAWLNEVRKRQTHIVQKHKLNFEDDDGDFDEVEGEGEVNLSDLDMNAIGKAGTKDKAQLSSLQRQMAAVSAELMTATAQLTLAEATERYDEDLGVGHTKQANLPLGRLHLTLVSARNLPRVDRVIGRCDPYVVISLAPESAGPRGSVTSTVIKNQLDPVWNQSFVIAPISTVHADIVFRVMDKDRLSKDERIGEVSLPLTDLLDQRPHDLRLQLPKRKGTSRQSVLYVQAQFQYSKVLPLRQKIAQLEEKKADLDRRITQNKLNLSE